MSLYTQQYRRPLSRASIATSFTHQSSPPSSSSSGMPRSVGTSVTSPTEWSEDGTEIPAPSADGGGYHGNSVEWNDEPPLIDFDEPVDAHREKPADRLKMLLRQMEAEVEDTNFRREASQSLSPDARSQWRNGRREMVQRAGAEDPAETGKEELKAEESEEDEDDSPPTPPLRITNPYLSRVTGDRPPASKQSQQRMTSRAAVLRNSTPSIRPQLNIGISHSPDPPVPRTPLETFIATHNVPISDSSSSRSMERSISSTSSRSSRKGKERAVIDIRPSTSVRRSHTPRKMSIELPPDNSIVFAEGAAPLDGRAKEYDMSDSSAEPPWDEEDSTTEEPPPRMTSPRRELKSSPGDHHRQREETERLSRLLKRPSSSRSTGQRRSQEDESLPTLPEPSLEEDEDQEDAISSRQASLFRSPSKSRSFFPTPKSAVMDRSPKPRSPLLKVSPNTSRFKDVDFAPHANAASISTPVKDASAMVATPHPPGRWFTPSKAVGKPPAPAREVVSQEDGDVSMHRLRVSPRKKVSPKRVRPAPAQPMEEEGDSSFMSRTPGLFRMIAKTHPLPRPSSAVLEAKDALSHAAEASTRARSDVEDMQRRLVEALSATQAVREGAVAAAKRTWSWGNWAWWMSVEILLLWGVFRVTLDYATSAHYLASIDPFSISCNAFAISMEIPNALSEFIIPRRGSANFFDLLEMLDLWRRLDGLGVMSAPSIAGGIKMLGGVPT